jgi:hypothetical protein
MCQIKSVLLLLLLISTSACSSIDTIAILNDSQAPLRLEYTFKRTSSDDVWLRKPLSLIATVVSDKAGEVNCPWALLSPAQYSYDPASQKVSVEVPPATALRIAQLSNYVETGEWAAEQFPIASVTIDGAAGVIHCEGEQARKQFKNLKRSLHAIDYK